jgi:hypothetical protein
MKSPSSWYWFAVRSLIGGPYTKSIWKLQLGAVMASV